MVIRVDKLRTPRGMISNGRMYTIIFKDNKLYLIYTGLGVNVDFHVVSSPLAKTGEVVIGENAPFFKGKLKKITEIEKNIQLDDLDNTVSRNKKSYVFTRHDILKCASLGKQRIGGDDFFTGSQDVQLIPGIWLQTTKGKFKLLPTRFTNQTALRELFIIVQSWREDKQ